MLFRSAHEAQADAMLLLEQVLVLRPRLDDVGHVHVIIGGEQRRVVLRFLETLGDGLAQAGHLDAFMRAAGTGGGGSSSEERRVGKVCVRTVSFCGEPYD